MSRMLLALFEYCNAAGISKHSHKASNIRDIGRDVSFI